MPNEMPRWLFIILVLLSLGWIIGAPFFLWYRSQDPAPSTKLVYWLLTIFFLTVFMVALGYRLKRKVLGILIDERNKMTLSRLQFIIWTVIILSGYATAALRNLLAIEGSDPLAVALPEELWWLLGISTASLVGSPLVLLPKTGRDANTAEQVSNSVVISKGRVAANPTPQEASLVDMFTGDEVGNDASVDISKVQLFFFTIVIVLAYGVGLGELFATTTGLVNGFPELSESILVLLGISHAGYLSYKGIPHSADATSSPRAPNVVGQGVDPAEQAVRSAGLSATIEGNAQRQEAAGQVFESVPAAGSWLAAGAPVTLRVSAGP